MKRLFQYITNIIYEKLTDDMGLYFDYVQGNETETWMELYDIIAYGTIAEKKQLLNQIRMS